MHENRNAGLCASRSTATARYVLTLALIAAASLAGTRAYAASSDSKNNPTVATVGNHPITEADIDAELKPQIMAWQNRLYQLRRRAIMQVADDYLITQAAKKAGLSPDEYLKRKLGGASKVSDQDAKQFYDRHKAQIPQPFEQIKPRIIAYLEHRQANDRRDALLGKLRRKYPVKVMLKPLRFNVETSGNPALGAGNAPVTIAEFADFQCPYCKRAEATLGQVRDEYGNKVRLVYLDFPLSMHPYAMGAAEAARCAGEQGKFWPYHDALFADPSKLAPKDLKQLAGKLKLNTKKFNSCFDHAKYKAAIDKDIAQGRELGVDGTPGFFINGRPLSGAQPAPVFEALINEELAQAKTASNPASPNAKAPAKPKAD